MTLGPSRDRAPSRQTRGGCWRYRPVRRAGSERRVVEPGDDPPPWSVTSRTDPIASVWYRPPVPAGEAFGASGGVHPCASHGGTTVNAGPVVCVAPTSMLTGPEVVPAGTTAVIAVGVQLDHAAAMPWNRNVPAVPSCVPRTVTSLWPAWPAGARLY